jgi:ribose 5-phosphate isomerase B
MKVIVGSDEKTHLTDAVVLDLEARGFEVRSVGPLAGEPLPWGPVAELVGRAVAAGVADFGVLFCWTGTGVCMAANKVPGVRAALSADAETARGARRWNDANILVMSLRKTTAPIAKEMLDAWLAAEPDPSESPSWEVMARLDGRGR